MTNVENLPAWTLVSAHKLDRIGTVVLGWLMPYDPAEGERVQEADGTVWHVVSESVRRLSEG